MSRFDGKNMQHFCPHKTNGLRCKIFLCANHGPRVVMTGLCQKNIVVDLFFPSWKKNWGKNFFYFDWKCGKSQWFSMNKNSFPTETAREKSVCIPIISRKKKKSRQKIFWRENTVIIGALVSEGARTKQDGWPTEWVQGTATRSLLLLIWICFANCPKSRKNCVLLQ